MNTGMYAALSGAVAQERALEVVADNMANVSTPGFKATQLSFNETLAGAATGSGVVSNQVKVGSETVNWEQGALRDTQNPLDVALMGPGFFVVETQEGPALTRQGSFHIGGEGLMQTADGFAVMGHSGPIHAAPGESLHIDAQGGVHAGERLVDTLRRVDVADPSALTRIGNGMWRASANAGEQLVETPLQPGAIEGSNVNAVQSMTQLIGVQRAYEMYHRAIETFHSTEQKASSELG